MVHYTLAQYRSDVLDIFLLLRSETASIIVRTMDERITVLLVEDDPMLTELYQTKLEMDGYDVHVVTDGEAGIASAQSVLPQLILLDIMLPKLNGFEVLRVLKQDPNTAGIPVIVVTNLGGAKADTDKKLALSLGAEEFLVKTFHLPDDIVGKIQTVLAKHTA
jgi:DNA-binding response OmpR family regulator